MWRSNRHFWVIAVGSLIAGPWAASGAILHVPADYATIQAAIDAAAPEGDEVVLADGTYTGAGNMDLDFLGKLITLCSENGDPNACIIDCQSAGRAVYIHDAADRGAVTDIITSRTLIAGIQITNGHVTAEDGGAILCTGSPVPVQIENCTFTGNVVAQGAGGAVWSQNCTLSVDSCHFEGCHSWLEASMQPAGGGAIWIAGGYATVANCFFADCQTNVYCDYGGGAVGAYQAAVTVDACQMTGCYAHGDGGGFWSQYCNVTLRGNRVSQCEGFHNGGAVGLRNCTGLVANNALYDNIANEGAGAILVAGGSASIGGCTVADNSGGDYGSGGGLAVFYPGAEVAVSNCIFWGNTAYADPQIYYYGTAPTVSYSDVEGGWSGTGNLNQYPSFGDAEYHLYSSSPCREAGDPAYAPLGETDFDGQIRKWPEAGRVDMGADEYGSFRYGDLNCDGGLNCFDIDPFVMALTDQIYYGLVYPECWYVLADINGDGAVNSFDIDFYIILLTGE